MARPQILQKPVHGKLFCGAVFRTFVETFNWVVDATANLKGDWDVNQKVGYIQIDRTDQDHPVLRFHPRNGADGGVGESLEVITGLEYTPSDGKLTLTKRKIKAVISSDDPVTETVIEAVDHIPG